MVWVNESCSIAELADISAPLPPDGLATWAGPGPTLALEAAGQRIVVIDAAADQPRMLFTARITPMQAFAVHLGAGLVASGEPGGRITLQDLRTGEIRGELAMGARALTALAFSRDGRLVAAGDDEGHVVVYEVRSGRELRRIDAQPGIRALAISGSVFPILIGDDKGGVRVQRRDLPPVDLPGGGSAVTALTTSPSSARRLSSDSGSPLVGRADGTIGMLEPGLRRVTEIITTPGGPVRALWTGGPDLVKALVGTSELCSWTFKDDPPAKAERLRDRLENLRQLAGQLAKWSGDLASAVSVFNDIRYQMREHIAADRAAMVDGLVSLDDEARDRIREVVLESEASIRDYDDFDNAANRVFEINPLPRKAASLARICLLFGVLAGGPILTPGHLDGLVPFFRMAVTVGVGLFFSAFILLFLVAGGAVSRAVSALIVFAGLVVMLGGPQLSFSEPGGVRRLAARWLPAADHLSVHLAIPYPTRLGVTYTFLLVAGFIGIPILFAVFKLAAGRHGSDVPGARLLRALLYVAYNAQRMTDDRNLAISTKERKNLHAQVRDAAGIASGAWVRAMRTDSAPADRIVADTGRAIAAAISRWERQAALGGAEMHTLASAFAIAVSNAADGDWQALAADPALIPPRRRARVLVGQGLSLIVPLGAAAGIITGIRPLPAALVPLITLLGGIAVGRILRWLGYGSDIDPGLAISDLLRKPR